MCNSTYNKKKDKYPDEKKDKDVYQTLTNKLSELVDNIDLISIDKDDKRDKELFRNISV